MTLVGYLAILRRRFLAGLLCLVAGGLGGWYVGDHTPRTYQATARSLVSLPDTAGVQQQLTGAQLASSYLATYAKVATSRSVAAKVVRALGLSETPGALQGQLSASVEEKTFIINVTATDGDPLKAKSLADTAAVALGERVAELGKGLLSPVRAQVLDQAAIPGAPIGPRPSFDISLGLALGLAAGVALMALLEALDRTIKTAAQGEAALLAPQLSLIPRRRSSGQQLVLHDGGAVEAEPYRALRTAVQFTDPDVSMRTILVTSASPGDGKTTTTTNLALALAAAGERVVVVDADLRRAALAGVFGLEDAVGLSSLLLRQAELEDVLQSWAPNVTVLPSGKPLPPNPSEVLGSNFMLHLLDALTARFDVVLIDTPPVLPVTDAVALSTQVDAVLLVARHGKTQRGQAAEARRRLDAVGANVIGFVLNGVPARESAGYYADYEYVASRKARRAQDNDPKS